MAMVVVALWMGTGRGVGLLELGGGSLVVQARDRRCFSDGLGGVDVWMIVRFGVRRRSGREGAAVTMGGLERVRVSKPWLLVLANMDGSFVGGHFLSLLLLACLFGCLVVCYRVRRL